MERALTERIDPAAVQRELAEVIARTDSLSQVIEATLADAEKELDDIRRMSAARQSVIPALAAGIQRSASTEAS
jgi:hypothetical protein